MSAVLIVGGVNGAAKEIHTTRTIWSLRFGRRLFMLPNQSPEPTAVGAVSSAVAVHTTSRRWLSFFRWRLHIYEKHTLNSSVGHSAFWLFKEAGHFGTPSD